MLRSESTVAKQKYYAIKTGYNTQTKEVVKNQIFTSWAEASPFVQGINKKQHGVQAEYKSFSTLEEAKAYLKTEPFLHKSENNYPIDCLHCYVDGSFSEQLQNYSFGLVCVKNQQVIFTKNGLGKNKEAVSMRQIAGELAGTMNALIYAKKHGHKKVVIFFDYKGVALHATGNWKRDNNFSQIYYEWMQKFFKENPDIEVIFCKVDAHTGDDFNELADGFAKLALGIKPDNKFYRFAEKYGLQPE